MSTLDDVFAMLVAAAALSYAYPFAMELFIAWYSGVDRPLVYSPAQCLAFAVSSGVAAAAIVSLF